MKKILTALLLSICIGANAYEIYDAGWCRKNGGKIEFDHEFNINFNCITRDFNSAPYTRKIYNFLVIPFYSAILAEETPRFLKLTNLNGVSFLFDEYNFKITRNELEQYILSAGFFRQSAV